MERASQSHKTGIVYAISSGICYGFIGYFGINIITSGLSVYNMLFWRFFIATIFTVIFIFLGRKNLPQLQKDHFKVVLYGAFFYGTSSALYFIACQYIGTGLAMVIFFTYPAIIMLINFILYSQAISKTYYLSFGMIILGILLLVDIRNSEFDIAGIGFALLSALFYALYIVGSKAIVLPPLVSTLMVSIGCALSSLMFTIIDSSFAMPPNTISWLNIIGMAIICTALPILLLLKSLQYISSEKVAILSITEPLFVVIFGIILLDEKITLVQIIGVIIMLSGASIAIPADSKSTQ